MKYFNNKFVICLSIQLVISFTIMAATCKQTVPNSALVKDGTLVMSTNPTLPPLQFVDSTGTLRGMRVKLGKEVAKRLCLKPEYIRIEFSAMIPGLQAGRWDMINTGIFWNPKRAAMMNMIPYESAAISISVKKGNPLGISKKEDLAGKILIDTTVPLQKEVTKVKLPSLGSAALVAQAVLGPETEVVSALQNIGSHLVGSKEEIKAEVLVTGNNEETVSTGISNIAFEPIHKFRTDIMTGKFTVDANDNGKTFLCSGANASGIISHGGDYSFDVFNISDNAIELFKTEADSFNSPVHTLSPTGGMEFSYKDSSLTSGPSTGVITPLPSIVSFDDNYYEGEDGEPEVFLIDGISGLDLSAGNLSSKSLLVNISDRDCAVAGASLGSMSGMLFDSDASRSNLVDSGVIVVDHDQIVLTSDDSGLTGVINTDSTLVLPSGFSDAEHVTFLNSKNEEARVISASGYGHLPVVELLINNKANITAWDNEAVRWASKNGHIDVVKLLINHKADITAGNNYALRMAAKNNHIDVVNYIKSIL